MAKTIVTEKRKDSAGPMMMELIVAILIFALVSSACVALFAKSRNMSRSASQLGWASDEAVDLSEMLRASNSEEEYLSLVQAEYPKAAVGDHRYVIWVDEDQQVCDRKDADMAIRVRLSQEAGMLKAKIRAVNVSNGALVYRTNAKHYIGE